MNPLNANYQTLTKQFLSPTFIQDWRKSHSEESQKEEKLSVEELDQLNLKHWKFYPKDLLFELPLER